MRKTARLEREVENDVSVKKETRNYLFGVLVLSLSAIIVKLIGLFYKIPMLKLLGSEGMGYFNAAYEIYALFCIISTAGMPVAMSVIISSCSDNKGRGALRVFGVAFRMLLVIGVVCTSVMLAFAFPFSHLLGESRSVYAILAISPALLFACLTGAYRGYFQGLSKMTPTAISQFIEAACKLIFGLVFVFLALRLGFKTEIVAAFAALGLVVGSFLSMLYLCITKRISGDTSVKNDGGQGEIIRMLWNTSVPITLSAAVLSVTRIIDMTMIIRRLQSAGYTGSQAFSVYGSYTTLAVPLFALAPALISSVAHPLVPRLGDAIAIGDKDAQTRAANDAVRLSALISMPMSIGISLFSKEILELLFRGQAAEIELCAPLLSMLGLSVTLSCLVTVGNAMLQAYGHARIPMISMLIGSGLKIVISYFLIGNARIGIMGAPISTLLCDLVINIINSYYISKSVPMGISVGKSLVRPFVAALVSVLISKISYGYFAAKYGTGAILTLSFIGLAAVLYVPLCLLLGAVSFKEITPRIKGENQSLRA